MVGRATVESRSSSRPKTTRVAETAPALVEPIAIPPGGSLKKIDYGIEGMAELREMFIEEYLARCERAGFALEVTVSTRRVMIESIAPDPLRKGIYFRFNQRLQQFVNASARFRTSFAG